MSAIVQAVATVVATPVPSPTVVVTPVVHAVATVASHPAVTNVLNKLASLVSPSDVVVAAGVVATAILAQLNRIPWLSHEVAQVQDMRRFALSVGLPFAGTYVATLGSGVNSLGVAPWIFVISQFAFYIVKGLKYAGAKSVSNSTTAATVTQDAAPVLAVETPPAG